MPKLDEPKHFLEIFPEMAEDFLRKYPNLVWSWKTGKRNKSLIISKQNNSGFDVGVVCETYGLYPNADKWFGAPWDVSTPKTTLKEMCIACLDFVHLLLTRETRLRVLTSNEKPYRWLIEYLEENNWKLHEEVGLLFYNYFGKRSEFILRNNHLPLCYA